MELVVRKLHLHDEKIEPLIEDREEAMRVFFEISKGEANPFMAIPELSKDLQEFIELCLSKRVEFVLVGGYAVAAHGAPRFTEDVDLFIAISEQNSQRIMEVLLEFGFSSTNIDSKDFLNPGQVIQFGRKPNRIDLLTSIDGVSWDEAWTSRIEVSVGPHKCWVIGKDRLIQNKKASGRPQDIADVARLELPSRK